jgi:hypothetical protein
MIKASDSNLVMNEIRGFIVNSRYLISFEK